MPLVRGYKYYIFMSYEYTLTTMKILNVQCRVEICDFKNMVLANLRELVYVDRNLHHKTWLNYNFSC